MKDETGIVALIAHNVRRRRKAAGLSQEELGFEAGLDRTYISQVERGQRNVTVIVLARLARALKMTASQLLRPMHDKALIDSGKNRATLAAKNQTFKK